MRKKVTYRPTKKKGIFKSPVIPAKNGAMYRIVIDTNQMIFKIINIKNNGIVRSTEKCGLKPCNDWQGVVRQARRQAIKFGLLLETRIDIL